MMNLPEANTELSKLCISLLKKRLLGQMTEAEFEKELAYLMLSEECFKELWPKAYPARPEEMRGYENLKPEGKEALGNDPNVRAYYREHSRIENENKTKLIWLQQWKKSIPEGDIIAHRKVEERIGRFTVNGVYETSKTYYIEKSAHERSFVER